MRGVRERRGIWNRTAFRALILNSIDQESVIASRSATEARQSHSNGKVASDALAMTKKSYRIIGPEFFGEIVKVGSKVKMSSPATSWLASLMWFMTNAISV